MAETSSTEPRLTKDEILSLENGESVRYEIYRRVDGQLSFVRQGTSHVFKQAFRSGGLIYMEVSGVGFHPYEVAADGEVVIGNYHLSLFRSRRRNDD